MDGEVIRRRKVWLGAGLSPPPDSHDTYCMDATCGTALLAAGWTPLAEFGTMSPSRFGGTTLSSENDLSAAGWTKQMPGGGWKLDDASYYTAEDTLQWSLASSTQQGHC